MTKVTNGGALRHGGPLSLKLPYKLRMIRNGRQVACDPMAPSVGSLEEQPLRRNPTQQDKKKGCREKKCSNWKGGKCRCGRD